MRVFIYLLLLVLVSSCENEYYRGLVNNCVGNVEGPTLSFFASDEIRIALPPEFDGGLSIYEYYSSNGTDYIAFCGNGQSILFFNMRTGLLEKIVEPNEDVPLIDEILTFHIKSLDSIFIFKDLPPKAYLVNSNGQLVNSWELRGAPIDWDGVDEYALFGTHSGFQMDEDKFYISLNTSSFFKINDRTGLKTEAIYDVGTDSWEAVYGELPKFYSHDREVNFIADLSRPDRVFTKDNVVISYPQSHEIHVYDKLGNLEGEHCAGSQYIRHLDEPLTREQSKDRQQTFFRFAASSSYLGIYYHSDLNVYTRLVRHKFDIEEASGKLRSPCEIEYSLIVMDKDFNKIKEVKLDDHLYDWRFAKGTPSGFWLMPICDAWPGEDIMNYTTHLKLELSDT